MRWRIVFAGLVLAVVLAFSAGAFALFVWPSGGHSDVPATISADEPLLTRAQVQDAVWGHLDKDLRQFVNDIEAEYLGARRWQIRLTVQVGSREPTFALFELSERNMALPVITPKNSQAASLMAR
jgi:hypothetical protein